MPVYEYECEGHGPFTLVRPMSRAGEGGQCPACGGAARRVITPPNLFTMSPSARDAAFRNERSRHEPRLRRSGCAHRAGASGSSAEPGAPLKPQSYTGVRPWVVEHR